MGGEGRRGEGEGRRWEAMGGEGRGGEGEAPAEPPVPYRHVAARAGPSPSRTVTPSGGLGEPCLVALCLVLGMHDLQRIGDAALPVQTCSLETDARWRSRAWLVTTFLTFELLVFGGDVPLAIAGALRDAASAPRPRADHHCAGSRAAGDVILAWELGNELHATMDRAALVPFVTAATAEIRTIDSSPLSTAAACRWCRDVWYSGADRLPHRRVSEMPPCRRLSPFPIG